MHIGKLFLPPKEEDWKPGFDEIFAWGQEERLLSVLEDSLCLEEADWSLIGQIVDEENMSKSAYFESLLKQEKLES